MSEINLTVSPQTEADADGGRMLRGMQIAAVMRVRQDGDLWIVPSPAFWGDHG